MGICVICCPYSPWQIARHLVRSYALGMRWLIITTQPCIKTARRSDTPDLVRQAKFEMPRSKMGQGCA